VQKLFTLTLVFLAPVSVAGQTSQSTETSDEIKMTFENLPS